MKYFRTGEWFRQNATTEVWPNDPTTWTSTLASKFVCFLFGLILINTIKIFLKKIFIIIFKT